MRRTRWLMAAAAACSPEAADVPPMDGEESCAPTYAGVDEQTEHLSIFNATGGPVCRGTLRMLDLEVERSMGELGLPLVAPLPVYYGPEPTMEMCGLDSQDHLAGCARGLGCDTYVATSFFPQVHELVHAIRLRSHLDGPAVLEEGIAVLLGDGRPFNGVNIAVSSLEQRSMVDLVELEREDIGTTLYAYGAHFLSFAIEQHGLDAVTDVLADERYPDELDALFETHLGVSLATLDERWRAEAWDTWYTSFDACRDIVPLGDGFELGATLDCANDQTLGHFGTPLFGWPIDTCLSTTERVDVTIVATGGPGHVTLSGRDCVPEDVGDPYLTSGFTLPVPIEAEYTLGRCTWWAYFEAEWDEAPASMQLRVLPR